MDSSSEDRVLLRDQVAALVALRLYNQKNDFNFTCNYKNAKKFNDIAFSTEVDGKMTSFLIQVVDLEKTKIAIANLRDKKHDLGLINYFEAYRDLLSFSFAHDNADPILDNRFSTSHFILYTNATFDDTNLFVKENCSTLDFLSTDSEKDFNIKFDRNVDIDCIQDFHSNHLATEFLNQFTCCTTAASSSDLDELIKNQLSHISPLSDDRVLDILTNLWIDFIKSTGSSDTFLNKKEIKTQLISLLKISAERIDNIFSDEVLSLTKTQISLGQLNVLVCSDIDETKTCFAVLEHLGYLKDPNIKMSADNFGINDDFERQWRGNEMVLVLDCENLNALQILDLLKDLRKLNPSNTIIFVADKCNVVIDVLKPILDFKEKIFACKSNKNTNLKPKNKSPKENQKVEEVETKKQLNYTVKFQGLKCELKKMVSNLQVIDDVCSESTIKPFIADNPSCKSIGDEIDKICQVPNCFVKRKLVRNDQISSDFLIHNKSSVGVFALSGIGSMEASKIFSRGQVIDVGAIKYPINVLLKKIFIVIKKKKDFDELSKNIPEPVHWFKKGGGHFWLWKNSSKDAHLLNPIFNYNHVSSATTDEVLGFSNKVVLVTGDAGVGKTCFLVDLANEYKKQFPQMWVVYVNLANYKHFLTDSNFNQIVDDTVKQILAYSAGVFESSPLVYKLFEHSYSSHGNIVVLLDGLDDIVPDLADPGLKIVKALCKSNVAHVVIASQPWARDILEQAGNTIAYSLKPFQPEDRVKFLKKYWQDETVDDGKLQEFIDMVVKNLPQANIKSFANSPLMNNMIGVVFQQKWNSFKIQPVALKKEKLVDLFNGYFLHIHKQHDNLRNFPYWSRQMVKMSLLSLLLEKEFISLYPTLNNEERLKLKLWFDDGNEITKCIKSFNGTTPKFVHATFAEYFLASFLFEHCKSSTSVANFMRDFLFRPDFKLTSFIFNSLAAGSCVLHNIVLEKNNEELSDALKRENANEWDSCGRSALHLAAGIPDSSEIICELLKYTTDTNVCDQTLRWRPLDYALKIGDLGNINALYHMTTCTPSILNNVLPVSYESFMTCMKRDYINLLKYLIGEDLHRVVDFTKIKPLGWMSNADDCTILHVAAACNASQILDYLTPLFQHLLDKSNSKQETPLLIAARLGCDKAIQVLLKYGASISLNKEHKENFPRLIFASRNLVAFELALKHAKDKRIPDLMKELYTILAQVKSEFSISCLRSLIKLDLVNDKTSVPILCKVATLGNVAAMQILIDNGADVNIKTRLGTPLHSAVYGKHKNAVELLLDQTSIDVNAVDFIGATAPFKAIEAGTLEIFKLFALRDMLYDCRTRDGRCLKDLIASNETISRFMEDEDLHLKEEPTKNTSSRVRDKSRGREAAKNQNQQFGVKPMAANISKPSLPGSHSAMNSSPSPSVVCGSLRDLPTPPMRRKKENDSSSSSFQRGTLRDLPPVSSSTMYNSHTSVYNSNNQRRPAPAPPMPRKKENDCIIL